MLESRFSGCCCCLRVSSLSPFIFFGWVQSRHLPDTEWILSDDVTRDWTAIWEGKRDCEVIDLLSCLRRLEFVVQEQRGGEGEGVGVRERERARTEVRVGNQVPRTVIRDVNDQWNGAIEIYLSDQTIIFFLFKKKYYIINCCRDLLWLPKAFHTDDVRGLDLTPGNYAYLQLLLNENMYWSHRANLLQWGQSHGVIQSSKEERWNHRLRHSEPNIQPRDLRHEYVNHLAIV